MTEKLNEKAHRREDFAGGIPVTMADGQEWFLAEPLIRFRPADTEVGFEEFLYMNDDGQFHRLVQKHEDLLMRDKEDFAEVTDEWIGTEMAIGRAMLERNYDLTMRQLQDILQFNYDDKIDPVATEIRQAVIGILSGNVPKPTGAGGGQSPSAPVPSGKTECSSETI